MNFITKRQNQILLVLSFFIYGIFLVMDGPLCSPDSQGYIDMVLDREGFYPLLLLFFRSVFGMKTYLFWVAGMQSVLAALATYFFINKTKKVFDLSYFSTYLLFLLQLFFLLLCRFGSKQGGIYPCMILTEGITYSLYLLYVTSVFQTMKAFSWRNIFIVCIYAFLLTFTRTQLIVTLIAPVVLFTVKGLCKKISCVKWIKIVCLFAFTTVLVMVSEKIYTYGVYGHFTGQVGSNSFFLTSGIYYAKQEDISLLEEKDQQIFQEIYNQSIEKGANYSFSENDNIFSKAQHYSQHFDIIKFEIVQPILSKYCDEEKVDDYVTRQILCNQLSEEIGKPLAYKNLSKRIIPMLEEFVIGLMRTIGKASIPLIPLIGVLYIGYVLLMVLCFKTDRNSTLGWSALFILIIIMGNVALTDIIIFCEPRYVLYNFIPFYSLGFSMLVVLQKKRKMRRENDGRTVLINME